MTIRTIIVDDEPHAREWLKAQVEKDPDVEVVAECGDGFKAAIAAEELKPDLIFLDVQMPGLDGFGVVEMLSTERMPAIVFVTAYDQYAVRAFDVHALDYILKPFGHERVQQALRRAKAHLSQSQTDDLKENLLAVLGDLKGRRGYPDWLLLKNERKSFFLRIADVDWIEASRNNVLLHVGKETHSYRETMQSMESRLDPRRFLRIHRSTIVNIERVKELEPWFNGDYLVTLKDGRQLTLSSSYRHRLSELRKLES